MTDVVVPAEVQVPPAKVITENLERPELDNRQYRVIKLENELEVLLVHDPDTDKASAAMDVYVGNYADSPDLPGQAHALEHMLFLGTEKYPVENDYSQYLSEHGGYSNAYTSSMDTNYYFEVSKDHLEGALDRFAQFFIAPLFREECLDRELRAVDSENKKNLQSDTWRIYQLAKTLSSHEHPFHKFSTGNLTTLKENPGKKGINVREEFMKFHERHYSANIMKLVVFGREPLDTLQSWVEKMFIGIKNKSIDRLVYPGQPLTDKELLTQVIAKPVMDTRSLELCFPYMPEDELYRCQPSRYLAHLIGHEGPGSILAYLKEKGWANALSAGGSPITTKAAFFEIDIKLTTDGLKHWKEVVKVVFQYITILRSQPPQEWILKELQQVAAIDFRFKQKDAASSFTSHMSSIMQRPYPREWLLSGTHLIREFNPEQITQAINHLTPKNFRLTIVSQVPPEGLGEMDQTEQWYGTEYRVDKISEEFLGELSSLFDKHAPVLSELHLPHPNEFIPSNFEVEKKEVKQPTKIPTLIKNTKFIRVWFKKDDTFWVPKAVVYVLIKNPLIYATPANSIKSRMYCLLVRDALNEYAYDAEISGLEYDLYSYGRGLLVEVAGYNHKLPILLEKVLSKMRDIEIREDRFNVLQERIMRGLKNWDFIQPYSQIFESRPPPFTEFIGKRSVIIPEGSHYIYPRVLKDPKNINNCIEYLLFVGRGWEKRSRALLNLFIQVTEEPAFDTLRTKEQLGYIVWTGRRSFANTYAYRVLVQSERTVAYLDSRIESFLENFKTVLDNMSDTDFQTHVKGLITKLTEKPKYLQQETGMIWGYIENEFYDFMRIEEQVAMLESLAKQDLIDFYNHYINPASTKRAKLAIHMVANTDNAGKSQVGPLPLAEQRSLSIQVIDKVLNQLSIKSDLDVLNSKFAQLDELTVDNTSGTLRSYLEGLEPALDKQKLNEAITTAEPFLKDLLKSAKGDARTEVPASNGDATKSTVESIVQKGQAGIDVLLNTLGVQGNTATTKRREGVVIEDVTSWKAGMELSSAPSPVKPLVLYEELNVKL
ncbi:hypothetical protein BJ508DRAFT_97930 [Ascobolus immersus RN42]|uniref:A-pheromone processing metallopeptidase Ste23 n=1 Tax=Ascobolus immersus RN42 TaxID=1160509 RepID=A0A3N4ISW3_ASCIM|nr:hypothetical protein BJ508DRAFT_97930 [Ascobolus immersus RN42]